MIGWYHSHPGYGCWLSGIDVGTQATQQMYQEPFLAIVIDPHRTIAAGKVEIGAFRTYPEVSDSITLWNLGAQIGAVRDKPWHSDISAQCDYAGQEDVYVLLFSWQNRMC